LIIGGACEKIRVKEKNKRRIAIFFIGVKSNKYSKKKPVFLISSLLLLLRRLLNPFRWAIARFLPFAKC